MQKLRRLALGLLSAAVWPGYLVLVAFAVKSAPWPRDVAWPSFAVLLGVAASAFLWNAGRMAFRTHGWAAHDLEAPKDVLQQLRRTTATLAGAVLGLLTPAVVLNLGLIAPEGRPVATSSLGRLAVFGFEATCWVVAFRLLGRRSPLLNWLTAEPNRLGWAGRQRWVVAPLILAALALIVVLDAVGYHFTARRLTDAGGSTVGIALGGWLIYAGLIHLINRHAWRWHAAATPVVAADGAPPISGAGAGAGTGTATDGSPTPEDAGARLRKLAGAVVLLAGAIVATYVWNVDLALFRYLGERPLWGEDKQVVTLGDFTLMLALAFATGGVWRNTQTFFTVVVFPRMGDDPGLRFAAVTLGRYAVLAVGGLMSLSAVHLGLERIGVVLAALGVGLGFGLQEIVSNFVSGIILLVERPVRVGDLVTVGGTTGTVDRINIRATTIINGDNQSMIVPNRAFISGNLVNWTHKDKIVRLQIHVNVALGTDADRVTDLLLSIAHADPDVLNNPVSSAWLDSIAPAALDFVLNAYVPDPSVLSRVRHHLNGEIQRRFATSGIVIPLPTRELRVQAVQPDDHEFVLRSPSGQGQAPTHGHHRAHRAEPTPYTPPAHLHPTLAPLPSPAEDCHRGVDE